MPSLLMLMLPQLRIVLASTQYVKLNMKCDVKHGVAGVKLVGRSATAINTERTAVSGFLLPVFGLLQLLIQSDKIENVRIKNFVSNIRLLLFRSFVTFFPLSHSRFSRFLFCSTSLLFVIYHVCQSAGN